MTDETNINLATDSSDLYQEFVGYRTNAKSGVARQDGCLTVYAERRNNVAVLGEYGGDAYPMVFEQDSGMHNVRCGMIVVADGVGNAAYPHPSLEKLLAQRANLDPSKVDGTVPKDEQDTKAMLSVFLRTLFGADIFDEKNADVLAYAMRCFAQVPTDGFFAADKRTWAQDVQRVMPFYKRDSQSLGSRLTCVGLYKKFRHFVKELPNFQGWTAENVSLLRSQIENFLTGELRNNALKLFSHSDAPDTVKRNRYFLGSTVALWFYLYNTSTKEVSAVALNCGDARCYLVDLHDGIRQISVDDALANGNMSAFVNYGAAPEVTDGFHDLQFHARIVQAHAPCMLFACSDGVYDTCPGLRKTDASKISLEYGEKSEPCDLLFEVNMLAAVRRSHSYEDFAREVALNFYAQGHRMCAEVAEGTFRAKRDDSATLGARMFGENNGLEIFEKLRQTHDTTLDVLFDFMQNQNTRSPRVPYLPPHVETSEERNKQIRDDFATGDFKMAILETLLANLDDCFAQMQASGTNVLWGIPNCTSKPMSFARKMFFNADRMNKILDCAIADWVACGNKLKNIPADWKAFEHVLAIPDILPKLKAINFSTVAHKLENPEVDANAECSLALFDWFEQCFFGAPLPEFTEVLMPNQCLRPNFEQMVGKLEGIYEARLAAASVATSDPFVADDDDDPVAPEVTFEEEPAEVVEAPTEAPVEAPVPEQPSPVLFVEEPTSPATEPVVEVATEPAPAEAVVTEPVPIVEAVEEPVVEVAEPATSVAEPTVEATPAEAPIAEPAPVDVAEPVVAPAETPVAAPEPTPAPVAEPAPVESVLWEQHREAYELLPLPEGISIQRAMISPRYKLYQGKFFSNCSIDDLVKRGYAKRK